MLDKATLERAKKDKKARRRAHERHSLAKRSFTFAKASTELCRKQAIAIGFGRRAGGRRSTAARKGRYVGANATECRKR
jgi:hypothetical protein